MSDEKTQPRSRFSERLSDLFEKVHPPGRGPYTYAELSRKIQEESGVQLTPSAIHALRRGHRPNPTMQTIQALADAFGVPAGYFFDDEVAEQTLAVLEVREAMRDQQVAGVALRSADLSPASLRALRTVVEQFRQLEGLSSDTSYLPGVDLNE